MVAGLVEIIRHHKNGLGTRIYAELAPLAAFFLDDDPFHKSLHTPHVINRTGKPLSAGKRKGKLFYKSQSGTIKIIVGAFFCKGNYAMRNKRFFYLAVVVCVPVLLFAQQLHVIPNGVLNKDDRAQVSGDYVRVRSGPTLEHRILTKVNKETEVTILERGETVETISDMQNYWYRIRIEESGLEGWMYGQYLQKVQDTTQKQSPDVSIEPIPLHRDAPSIVLKELGTLDHGPSVCATGDLDQNGKEEIILVSTEKQEKGCTLTGYEVSQKSLKKIYSVNVRTPSINKLQIFSDPSFTAPVIVASGTDYSYFYTYESTRSMLRLVYKLNSSLVTIGRLDGNVQYLVWAHENRIPDNDGTVTFQVHSEKMDFSSGRIKLGHPITYEKPLPVKKLISFDLDGDKKDEIIAEIGGKDAGGGIAVLAVRENTLVRVLNTGLNIYNHSQFFSMWGVRNAEKPKLVIYSTDPTKGNDASTDFGFIWTALENGQLHVNTFHPVNKMLDDVNNDRTVLLFGNGMNEYPFLVLDYEQESSRYSVKEVILN
jgi:hypothetical protein